MWVFRVSIFAILLCLGGVGRADEKDHCTLKNVTFASCSPKGRHFQSIVIAIPGWNGTCRDTFGEGEGNLLNVMRQRNFFDIDCFDYNSHHTKLAASRKQLSERIAELHKAGYTEFAFVTHSTGGVLALDFLLSEAMAADGQAVRTGQGRSAIFNGDRGMRLRALYSWAVPLNGVRENINRLGKIINLVNISPEVLPLLAPNSKYLVELKARLKRFDSAVPAVSPTDQANYGFDWVILQGQNDDWVVRNIDPKEPWFPTTVEIKTHVVRTNSSHSHNVADSGQIGAPLYPGEMMSDKALLALGLYPRINEYFAPTLLPTDELAQQRRVILQGVLGFAENRNLFQRAYSAVSKFIVLLLDGQFRRDPNFDEEAVAGLSRLLRTKANDLDYEYVVDFGDRLLNDIDRGFQARALERADRFGGGSKRAVRELVAMLDEIFKRVTELVRAHPELALNLRSSSGSLESFEQRVATVLPRFLAVADDETQRRTISALRNVAENATVPAVLGSDVVAQVVAYGRSKYRTLSDTTRDELGHVLSAFAARGNAISSTTLALLSEDVKWVGGQSRPLWFAMMSQDQIDALVAMAAPATIASKGQVKFLTTLIANGGAAGNSPDMARRAVSLFEKYLENAPAVIGNQDANALREAALKSQYPSIARSVDQALTSAGYGRLQ